ncbi:hypothetical protein BAE44_0004892 [Dichanthelium oligosanthes]|uniref:Uncharacterized protein n=1 Tax=Dichanthelium oligosanthes TaxID=888268 RepID=A0A1E5W9J0_9POAL|nr:hypothetical protein BAE44_0004892 [Dichanthelium oligosanthes]
MLAEPPATLDQIPRSHLLICAVNVERALRNYFLDLDGKQASLPDLDGGRDTGDETRQLPALQGWNKAMLRQSKSLSSQKGEKAELASPKLDDTEKLIEFMGSHYDDVVARVQSFDEFYHAIFELIELFLFRMFYEERGHLQYRIPEKRILQDAYSKHHKSEGELKKEEFVEISKEVLKVESFTFGKATIELGMFLFGVPACAFLAKRILPGLGWLSDDIVIPLATSGSVAYLIKSKRL